ncbi:hypothetical protein HON22_00565, partial [Candidatus Peregrinibacteria bacterium]|nr:hypothetical protein [Candidatus Peregrinibacteria bacterium]
MLQCDTTKFIQTMEKKNIGFETKVILKRFLKDIFGRVRSFPLAEKLLQKGIAKKVFTILEAHNTIKDGLSSTKYGLDYDINNFILITETVETLERKEDLSDIKKELSCKRLNNVTLYPSEEGVYIFVPQDYEEEIKNLIDIQSKIGSEISSYAGISITTVGHVIFHTIFPVDTSKVINFKVKHIGENATIKAFIKLLENYSRTHKDKEEIVNILSKSQIYKWFTQEFQVMIQKKYLKKSFSKTLTLNEKKNIFFELLD